MRQKLHDPSILNETLGVRPKSFRRGSFFVCWTRNNEIECGITSKLVSEHGAPRKKTKRRWLRYLFPPQDPTPLREMIHLENTKYKRPGQVLRGYRIQPDTEQWVHLLWYPMYRHGAYKRFVAIGGKGKSACRSVLLCSVCKRRVPFYPASSCLQYHTESGSGIRPKAIPAIWLIN